MISVHCSGHGGDCRGRQQDTWEVLYVSIKVGIIGYGRMGAAHARRVAALDGLHLSAVHDISPASLQQAVEDYPGLTVYESFDEFINSPRVDVVVVATPTSAHASLSIRSLQAGKHVVCEKAMCMNYAEAVQIQNMVDRTGMVFSVHQNRRWDDYYQQAKVAVDAGHLGQVRDLKIVRNSWSPGTMTWGTERWRPQWRSEKAYGGGLLFDWGGHLIDQALLLHGEPILSVYNELFFNDMYPGQDADDGFRMLITFADGARAHVEVQTGTLAPMDTGGWIVSGTEGGHVPGKLRIKTGSEVEERSWHVPVEPLAFWENFRDVVTDGVPQAVPVAESVRVMRIIDAAFQSAATGRPIVFPEPV